MKITRFTILIGALLILGNCKKKDDVTTTTAAIVPNDFLSAQKYDKLIIEIQSVSGYEPTDQTVNNLVAFLSQRLNKPSGISVVKGSVASPGKSSLSLDDLAALEKAHRTQFPSGKTLTAYFFIADCPYSGDQTNTKVLGITYTRSAVAIFEKTVRSLSGGLSQPSYTTLETTVMSHEFGHVLGLVNDGTPMQTNHQDVANGTHCNNKNCLMYYDVETSDSIANLTGNNIPSLDNNCISDLQANGGK